MKKINKNFFVLIFGLLFVTNSAFASITLGGFGDNGSQGTNSFGSTGTGDYLIVVVQGTTAPTAIDCGSDPMTELVPPESHSEWGRELNQWGIVNPDTNCTISLTGAANADVGYQYFTGVDASDPISDPQGISMTSSSPSISVTTDVDESYIVGHALMNAYVSTGSGTDSLGQVVETNYQMLISDAVISPVGTASLNVTTTGGMTAFTAVALNPEDGGGGPVIELPAGEEAIQVETYATILFVSSLSLFFYMMIFSIKKFRTTRGRV